MEVVQIDVFDRTHTQIETIDDKRRDLIVSNLAINVVHLNSMGRIVTNLNNERRHIGNRMEWAFLEFLSKNGIDYQEIRKNSTEISQTNPSEQIRIVVTVAEHKEDPNLLRVYANGSTDVFLTRCNRILSSNGQKVPFTYSQKQQIIEETIQKYQKNRLRVLALGYKDITKEEYYSLSEEQNSELIGKHFILVSLIALDDPTRGEEAQKAVSDCRKAGVNVRIISGDSTEATKAIAKETGVLCDFDEICVNNVCIEGEEFTKKVGGIITHSKKSRWRKDYIKNESAFKEWIKDLKIISCSSSEHKYLLVTGLKNEGYTVGVTGITPADTKSLLKADVGLTLNQLGSEVAKHSSDAILQNDSLKSIVIGILWGRNLFTIIKKYLQFYCTFLFVLLFIILFGTLIQGSIPFNLFELLWLHIIVDFIVLFVFLLEKPSSGLLLQNVVKYSDPLLNENILKFIILVGSYEILALIVTQILIEYFSSQVIPLGSLWESDSGVTGTIIFQIFFYFIMWNLILSKTLKTNEITILHDIWSTTGIIILALTLIQTALVTYGNQLISYKVINIYHHLFSLFIGLTPLLIGLITKHLIPSSPFTFKISENPLERNENKGNLLHYLRKKVPLPPKRSVKQKWRENPSTQYDTKGKLKVQWAMDEEEGKGSRTK